MGNLLIHDLRSPPRLCITACSDGKWCSGAAPGLPRLTSTTALQHRTAAVTAGPRADNPIWDSLGTWVSQAIQQGSSEYYKTWGQATVEGASERAASCLC
jgi:hypothetical protein